MPVSIASLICGSAGRRSRATGCMSRASAALSVRNGRCTGNESMPAWNAWCEREIVSLSASVSADSASKVIAVRVNRSAWVAATGATTRAVLPTSRNRRPSRVRRSDRLRATGARWPSSGGSWSIAVFTDCPRPARALPKPWRLRWTAVRVLPSKVRAKSSICTGIVVRSVPNTWPSFAARSEEPRTSSRYLRPSGERGRIVNEVSTGRSSPEPSIVTASSAPALPLARRTVRIVRTTPILTPPSRTSEPLVIAAEFSARTRTSSVGANGSPLLALYARKTAITATSTVTAPTRAGLDAREVFGRRVMGPGGSRGAVATGVSSGTALPGTFWRRSSSSWSSPPGGCVAAAGRRWRGPGRGGRAAQARARAPRRPRRRAARSRLAAGAAAPAEPLGSGAFTPGWLGPSQARHSAWSGSFARLASA